MKSCLNQAGLNSQTQYWPDITTANGWTIEYNVIHRVGEKAAKKPKYWPEGWYQQKRRSRAFKKGCIPSYSDSFMKIKDAPSKKAKSPNWPSRRPRSKKKAAKKPAGSKAEITQKKAAPAKKDEDPMIPLSKTQTPPTELTAHYGKIFLDKYIHYICISFRFSCF